jgi:hypothetical protein
VGLRRNRITLLIAGELVEEARCHIIEHLGRNAT